MGQLRKGEYRAVWKLINGQDLGVEALQEALSEISAEIDSLQSDFLRCVNALLPAERGTILELFQKLSDWSLNLSYRSHYEDSVNKVNRTIQDFLRCLLDACRQAPYPPELVPDRYEQLMEAVEKGGITNKVTLERIPRTSVWMKLGGESKYYNGMFLGEGEVIPLGFAEDYVAFNPPRGIEKDRAWFGTSGSFDPLFVEMIDSIQRYMLLATTNGWHWHWRSFARAKDIRDRLDRSENFSESRNLFVEERSAMSAISDLPIAQQAEFIGIFYEGYDEYHVKRKQKGLCLSDYPRDASDQYAIFLQGNILYGVCLKNGSHGVTPENRTSDWKEFLLCAGQTYSPLVYSPVEKE